jgi:hypothetical protein
MNSPIVYNLFKRPNIVKIVLNRIKLVEPKIIYLFSDGPRNNHEKELIEESRRLALQIVNWPCELNIDFLEMNIGSDEMNKYIFKEVFSRYDRLIYLEEDMLPSLSFFRFCDELLEYYKNDESVYLIGGMNFIQDYEESNNYSYIFQNYTSTWGIAFWKRTYENLDFKLNYLNDDYYNKLIKYKLKKSNKKFYKILLDLLDKKKSQEGELWLMAYNDNLLNNSLAIVPTRNLVRNIGDSAGSENGDERKLLSIFQRWVFDILEENIEFPLKHQKLKIVDEYYYDRVMKRSHIGTVKLIIIKFERALRILIIKGPKELIKKINKLIRTRKQK